MIIDKSKKHLEHRKFTLGPGHNVHDIVMREIDGEDGLEAGRLARAREALDEDEARSNIFREQIKLSVVSFRRTAKSKWERAQQPFNEFESWKLKSQNLVIRGYEQLNILTDEAVETFRSGSEVVPTDDGAPETEEDVVEELPAKRPVDYLRKIPV